MTYEIIASELFEQPASGWGVEHAANVGIKWLTKMNFPEAHPAQYFGKMRSIERICEFTLYSM